MLSEMLAALYRRFPDDDVVGYFRATLPLYRMQIVAQVLERQSLPLIPQFVLRAIQIGHDTVDDLSGTLGLDRAVLSDAAGQLLQGDLIEEKPVAGGPFRLSVTPEGERLLATRGAMSVTKRRAITFHFNPVTATLQPIEDDAVVTPAEEYQGDVVLPRRIFAPTLDALTVDMAREARGTEGKRDGDIIDLLEVRRSYADYLTGVDVFVLRAPDGSETIVAVHRTHVLPDLSRALTVMKGEGTRVAPDDADMFDREVGDVGALMPETTARLVEEIMGHGRRIAAGERAIAVRKAARRASEDREERAQIDADIGAIGATLVAQRDERVGALRRLQGTLHSPARLIGVEEQAVERGRAIAQATHDLLLVAPWMSARAWDDTACEGLGNAARRIDRLVIAYDIGRKRGGDQERLSGEARRLRKKIEGYARWTPSTLPTADNLPPSLRFEDIPFGGPSVLICDDRFALVTLVDLFNSDPSARVLPAPAGILFTDSATVQALTRGVEKLLGARRGAETGDIAP